MHDIDIMADISHVGPCVGGRKLLLHITAALQGLHRVCWKGMTVNFT
jgi:hypothetical protein